jgi:hypothetical protein
VCEKLVCEKELRESERAMTWMDNAIDGVGLYDKVRLKAKK